MTAELNHARLAKAKVAQRNAWIKERIKSMQKLVNFLMTGKRLTIGNMQGVGEISASCARKYRDMLIADGIMQQVPADRWKKDNAPEFFFAPDGAIKAELMFIKMNAEIEEPKKPSVKTSNLLPGTRIHIAADDNDTYTRHVRNAIVRPVRHPLDVALFGDGPAPSLREVSA